MADKSLRILTWNINSVRLRLDLLRRLMAEAQPDIVALQETKTPDEFFPADALREAGYPYLHYTGMKGYNGVAILSRLPFETERVHHRAGREDCRHIAAHFPSLFDLHCLYIPAGGDIPDPALNDKFAHKLDFVDELAAWFPDNHKSSEKIVALGDFNIAPLEHDVWSHKQLLDVVSHTPVEVARLGAFQDSLKFTDAIRHFVPEDQKCYTWWSYRNRDWKASNRGRRLDHIWVTEPLVPSLAGYDILKETRDWEQTSDHVPVVLDLRV